jgi:MFS transporter, DHA3 family, macrolide efflux protein
MFALLRERTFFLLWIAHTISILGDYVFFIAITFWIYAQTGSAFATGAVLITSTIPAFLFAPLAAMLVDWWDRRRIMLVAESARALLFLGLLGFLSREPQALWSIYLVGFLQTALAAFFWPARGALLPQLIEPPSLLAANAWYQVSDSGVRILAPALSAFALLQVGPGGVIILDVASFVLSAGCISLLTLPPQPQVGIGSPPVSRSSPAYSTGPQAQALPLQGSESSTKPARWIPVEGIATSGVSGLLLLGVLVTYTAGTLSILLPIFARTTLDSGPLAYGWLLTAQAIGEGAMSLFLGRTPPRGGPVKDLRFISGGLALGGLSLIFIASLHTLVSGLLLSVLFGAMMAAVSVHLLTLLQQRVANRFLGRTLATYAAVQTLAQVGGMGVATFMSGWVGVLVLLVLDGLACLAGSGFAWRRLMREDDPSSDAPKSQEVM